MDLLSKISGESRQENTQASALTGADNKPPKSVYSINAKIFCDKYSVSMAGDFSIATIERSKGVRSMSIREIDITCRNSGRDAANALCDPDYFFDILCRHANFVTEGEDTSDESIYGIRTRYNDGISKVKSAGLSMDSLPTKISGRFKDLEQAMADINSPIWDQERLVGFPKSLLKPEHCSVKDWDMRKNDFLTWMNSRR